MPETLERFSQIRKAVQRSKELGISDVGERREAVIDVVAKKNINKEPAEVIETALNKYLEIKTGLSNVPVLVDAIHAQKPTIGEALRSTTSEQFVKKARDEWDEQTGEIARRVARLTGASLIVAKKSRLTSDLNRAWWKREKRQQALPWEYSRSGRAALYWGIRKILSSAGRLNEDGQLMNEFWRISIHGMDNHKDYDFAIAGSKEPADSEFITWFTEKFKESLARAGLEPRVVIARSGDRETGSYSGPGSLAYFRKTPKIDRLVQHPAFGTKFQTIQLEIANKIRIDSRARKSVALAIAKVINEQYS